MKVIPSILLTLAFAAITPASAQLSTHSTSSTNTPLAPITLSAPATATPNTTPETTATPTIAPSDPLQAFSAGVESYEKGDYAKARDMFGAAESKSVSSALEYNFGNVCYQAGDFGGAVLHYLRALSLDPRDPDAHQNLALARQAANLTLPDPTRLDRFAGSLSENSWAWLAALAGWGAVYLAFLPKLFRWKGVVPWLLCSSMAAIAIMGGIGFYGAHSHARDGVVLYADTQLKLSPTTDSPPIGLVQAGEVAQTQEEHNGYFKVLTSDGHLGWLEKANYTPVWN